MNKVLSIISAVTLCASTASAQSRAIDVVVTPSFEASRPDAHAPITVMGDHTHAQGEWMFAYRFMQMTMDGNRSGTDRVSTEAVLNDFMVAPLDMTMNMHMVSAMFAPADHLTLALMIPYIDQEMDHVTRMGMAFSTETDGVGDLGLNALFVLHHGDTTRVHGSLGLSAPTGSIDERGDTPAMANAKLPYPMQLGSGTWDILPAITALYQTPAVSLGAQASARFRLDENDNDYTLGDRFAMTAWAAYPLNPSLSLSARLAYEDWDDIDGADPDLNPMMVPTARTDLRGGNRLDAGLGANLYIRNGVLSGNRIALEILAPIHQDLDGPQLETDLIWTLGLQRVL